MVTLKRRNQTKNIGYSKQTKSLLTTNNHNILCLTKK